MRRHAAARTLAGVADITPDGKIRLPADLDSVTAIGAEDHSEIGSAAVERIWAAARHWYQGGMHPAIQLCIRRHGRVVLNRAIGHGWGNAPTDSPGAEKVPVSTDTPFCVYSASKGITATVVHMLVERGVFSLDDRVCQYIPSYTSHGKHRTTIRHVLTHSAGVPFPTGPRPDLKRADDHEYAQRLLGELRPLYRPGLVHIYHALTWGPLMREIVYAATGKEIREILAADVLDPLGFRWTNFGVGRQDLPLVAPSHATGKPLPPVIAQIFRKAIGGTVHEIIPYSNSPQFLTTIIPSSNAVSTADELSRFAEIWRRDGELDGVRVLRPETLPGFRGGADARPLGYRVQPRDYQIRAVRAQRAGGVRQSRTDQHRNVGRPAARPCRRGDQQR
jgi:CubicO group peptidase (beta-lactamase class C family)